MIRWSAPLLAAAAALAACVPHVRPEDVIPDPEASLAGCCIPGRDPSDLYLTLMSATAPVTIPMVRDLRLRQGYLYGDATANAFLAGMAQPLDILLVSSKMHLAGNMTQGYLTHGAIFLGTAAQLRTLGLWDDPAIVPLHEAIRAGATLIEANAREVEASPLDRVLNGDGAVVLRPLCLSEADRRAALLRPVAQLGRPFDFGFDADTPDAVFCTELIDRALPQAELPRRTLFDTTTILPDDLARVALDGESPLSVAAFIHADRDGWTEGSADLLRATIAASWRPLP